MVIATLVHIHGVLDDLYNWYRRIYQKVYPYFRFIKLNVGPGYAFDAWLGPQGMKPLGHHQLRYQEPERLYKVKVLKHSAIACNSILVDLLQVDDIQSRFVLLCRGRIKAQAW